MAQSQSKLHKIFIFKGKCLTNTNLTTGIIFRNNIIKPNFEKAEMMNYHLHKRRIYK